MADRNRHGMSEICGSVRSAVSRYADVVAELSPWVEALPKELTQGRKLDRAVVIGGDGTLIRLARRLADLDLPLVGVNTGRLGFLAEFDPESLFDHAATIFGPEPPMHEQMMLATAIRSPDGHLLREDVAVNDCVISAGHPFRMVELRLSIDGAGGPILTGDGVVVASPVGSTAYNVSAGGPILHPTVEAIVITPLAAHSLAFRPILLRADSTLRIEVIRANQGTSALVDGQVLSQLVPGSTIEITRHTRDARFITNPAHTYWDILTDKLRWAAPPNYRERGS